MEVCRGQGRPTSNITEKGEEKDLYYENQNQYLRPYFCLNFNIFQYLYSIGIFSIWLIEQIEIGFNFNYCSHLTTFPFSRLVIKYLS